MSEIRERLRKNIQSVIDSSNVSKRKIAESLGVSQAAISNWVTGKNSPDLETLIRFCEMFGVTLDDIYSVDPTPLERDLGKEQLFDNYNALNLTGKMKLVDFSDDLVRSGKYRPYVREE